MTTEGLECVVAIPAKDEAQRIGACLAAVLDQRSPETGKTLARRWAAIVLANDCHDETAAVARSFGGRVTVVEAEFGENGGAGVARRRAMDLAAAMLGEGSNGLICTTDADSRPRADWLAHLFAAVTGGAEAVAGAVDFEPADRPSAGFGRNREREALYSALQAEISARADPEAHNPWPNHLWAWGANLAVTASAYRRVGGLPEQPLAEDRAFVERLKAFDVPVRHCLQARVWTSARRDGRAPGGLASLVDDHLGADVEACDAALEPAATALRRAIGRSQFRSAYSGGGDGQRIGSSLGVPVGVIEEALERPTFGAAWRRVEEASPKLTRRRLHPAELSAEIIRARRIIRSLAPDGPGDQFDRRRAATAGLWSAPGPSP